MSAWGDLNNEGVRLAAAGDLAAARDKLTAALAAAPPEDRAQCLLNLAQIVDLTGERQQAVDLLTEALAVAEGPTRSMAVAARADILPWLDRWDEAWQDVETALPDAEPAQQVTLRHSRVGLLMMAGRLVEAEQEATETVALAARHAPEYLSNLYANLAMLAEEAGDELRAATYRLLGDNPDQEPLGPRWLRFVELNTEGVVLLSAGDRAGAVAAFEAAYHETEGCDDAEALVCRAGAAGNLAGIVEEDTVRWSTEAITAARSAFGLLGDRYGVATTLTNALISRAQTHLAHTRLPEALADMDEALTVAVDDTTLATVRAIRARVLAIGGRYAEAAQEAQTALDLAYANAPAMAATVHMTLAEITSGTGDLPGATEHLALARDLCAATGDVTGEGTAVLSMARLAYLATDNDQADALYDEAAALTKDPRLLAACLVGRAAVAVLRGRPADALELVDQVHTSLGPAAPPLALVAVHQVRGSAHETAGDFAAAESCYAEAAARCAEAGLWHVALGMAWWRADALIRRAADVTGDERRAIAERALDLALPAALASEAVRQRFPHGPLREQWVALASAPATRSAFLAIRAVADAPLAAAYIDHLAGAVSFDGGSALPVSRADLVSLPEPPVSEAHLPYAAAGLPSDSLPVAGFELPPRVRVDPATPSTLDKWLDVAEERYGFPVRSAQAVASW